MRSFALIAAVLLVGISQSLPLDLTDGSINDGKTRDPWVPDRPVVKKTSPWYETTSMDRNHNGVSDVLDPYLKEDDLKTHVILSFDRDITERDKTYIESMGFFISSHIRNIDALVLGYVPTRRIPALLEIPGAVFVEPLGDPMLFSDIATPTVRAKGSEMFSPNTSWDRNYHGKGVSIAVIDTGIDDEHPSLNGKFLAGVDMTKPDNIPFMYPQDGSYNPDDIQGHGSTCSGIATGTGAPTNEYQGTAPEAHLVDVRIGTKIGYAPGEFWVGVVSDPHVKDATLRGIDWAIDHRDDQWQGAGDYDGIDIFSISWGVDVGDDSDGSDAYSRLLDRAVESGIIVVNAAGNEGPDNDGFSALSASSQAIIVAATDDRNTLEHSDDLIAFYSSKGPRKDNNDGNPYDELIPDIAAPGTNITNLQPDTTRFTGDASSNGYGPRGSGTSYATPNVAGIVALILEANPALEGESQVVEEILKATAERMLPPSLPELDPFWESHFGYGMVDAYRATSLASEIGNVADIDVMLQAHITGIEGFNVTQQYETYKIKGETLVSGLGWSKNGDFEETEYRIDDGQWMTLESRTNESFNPWTLELSGFEDGSQHRLTVRSVNSNSESLPAWIDFIYYKGAGEEEAGFGGGILTPLIIIALLAALGAGIYMWYSRRRSASG